MRTDKIRHGTKRTRKEVFAVESRHVTPNGETIRQIVIFDNHPASLRLLSSHLGTRRQTEFVYAGLAIVFALTIGLGIFWPLL